MKHCTALGFMREARWVLSNEMKTASSRELAIVLTKLDEAIMWRQEDMLRKTTPTTEEGV